MNSQQTDHKMIAKQILQSIGNYKESYPHSELRERLIRAEYSNTRFFNYNSNERRINDKYK